MRGHPIPSRGAVIGSNLLSITSNEEIFFQDKVNEEVDLHINKTLRQFETPASIMDLPRRWDIRGACPLRM